jgi:hypothetical protein
VLSVHTKNKLSAAQHDHESPSFLHLHLEPAICIDMLFQSTESCNLRGDIEIVPWGELAAQHTPLYVRNHRLVTG